MALNGHFLGHGAVGRQMQQRCGAGHSDFQDGVTAPRASTRKTPPSLEVREQKSVPPGRLRQRAPNAMPSAVRAAPDRPWRGGGTGARAGVQLERNSVPQTPPGSLKPLGKVGGRGLAAFWSQVPRSPRTGTGLEPAGAQGGRASMPYLCPGPPWGRGEPGGALAPRPQGVQGPAPTHRS